MSSLLFTRKITQKNQVESPGSSETPVVSLCVIKGTKPTHSTWKSRVCHRGVTTFCWDWVFHLQILCRLSSFPILRLLKKAT